MAVLKDSGNQVTWYATISAMSHLDIGTYSDRAFAWPREFKEKFPEKSGTFWKVAAFIGESRVRNLSATFDARVRTVNGEAFQVELLCTDGGETLARIDFGAAEIGGTDPQECVQRMKELLKECVFFVTEHNKGRTFE